MAETSELTKLTVTVVPGGIVDHALSALGDDRQEAAERALRVYAHATDLTSGEKLRIIRRDGTRITLLRVDHMYYAERIAIVAALVLAALLIGVVLS